MENILYNGDVPKAFRTDFKRLATLNCKELHLMNCRGPAGLSLHAAFLAVVANPVTTQDDVYVIRSGATEEPRAKDFPTIAFNEVCASVARAMPRYYFGYAMPVATRLKTVSQRPHYSKDESAIKQEGIDTVNFVSVEQGKGIEGLKPIENVAVTQLLSGPQAREAYGIMLEDAARIASYHLYYGLFPNVRERTVNSHSFVEAVTERFREKQWDDIVKSIEHTVPPGSMAGHSKHPLAKGPFKAIAPEDLLQNKWPLPAPQKIKTRYIPRSRLMPYCLDF